MSISTWFGTCLLLAAVIVGVVRIASARFNRQALLRSEARVLQRRAEADIDRALRQTVFALFEAARREQR
jgi:hypothetical protein